MPADPLDAVLAEFDEKISARNEIYRSMSEFGHPFLYQWPKGVGAICKEYNLRLTPYGMNFANLTNASENSNGIGSSVSLDPFHNSRKHTLKMVLTPDAKVHVTIDSHLIEETEVMTKWPMGGAFPEDKFRGILAAAVDRVANG